MKNLTISWEKIEIDQIPHKTGNAVLAFIHKNKYLCIDICYKKKLFDVVDELVWKYGLDTEKIALFIGYVDSDCSYDYIFELKDQIIRDCSALPDILINNIICYSDTPNVRLMFSDTDRREIIQKKIYFEHNEPKVVLLKYHKLIYLS